MNIVVEWKLERHVSWGYCSVKWLRKQCCENSKKFINSLWPSDTICRHRSGSTFAQIMACWLRAPSHYLNQRWLFISKVQWYSRECNAPNPRYIFPGGCSMKISQIPMFLHIAARVWGSRLAYINMKTVRFYVQTAINLQKKCLGTPDCKNMENM